MESDSSKSSMEYHDVVDSPNDDVTPGFFTPPPEKKKLFRTLSLRKKKSPSAPSDVPFAVTADDDVDEWTGKSSSKNKKGGSLRRFLSFRKKDKSKNGAKRSRSLEKPSSSETLCENIADSPEKLSPLVTEAPIASRESLTDKSAPAPLKTEVKAKNSKSETKVSSPKVTYKFSKSKKSKRKDQFKDSSVPAESKTPLNLSSGNNEEAEKVVIHDSGEILQIIEVDDIIPDSIHKAQFKLGSTEDTTSSRETFIDDIIDVNSWPSTSPTDQNIKKLAESKDSLIETIDVNPAIASRVVGRKSGIEVITVGSYTPTRLSHVVDPAIDMRISEKSRFEVISSGAEDLPLANDISVYPHKYPVRTRKRSDEYISIAFLDIPGSYDKASKDLEGFDSTSETLCNPLYGEAPKKSPQHTGEGDLSESFKTAASPELCNPPEETGTSVEVARQGWTESHVPSALSPTQIKRSKSLWKRLVGTNSGVRPTKSSEAEVDGIMSQNPGPSKKGKSRAAEQDQKDNVVEAVLVPEVTPAPDTPSTVANVEVKPKPVKISGDDLRKKLADGLKNGAGKIINAENKVADNLKAQLSKITDKAAAVSAAETITFIQQEKDAIAEKEKLNSIETKPDDDKPDLTDVAVPSTSKTEQVDMPATDVKKEHLYKILVIGELGTGKTSIIKRYVHQFFSQHYRATIGVDFALKVLNWDESSIIRLQLWDIAGQERFGNMTRVYYKEAVGAFIVFDVTRGATFDAVQKWKQDLDSKVQLSDGSPIPCVLLANKCDQPKEGVVNNKSKMDEYCRENGFSGWYETSAKDNINIEEAARGLVVNILQNDKLKHGDRTQDPDKIALGTTNSDSGGRTCNC